MCLTFDTVAAKDCAVCDEQTRNPLYEAECEDQRQIGPDVQISVPYYYTEYVCSEPCMAEYERRTTITPGARTDAVVLR